MHNNNLNQEDNKLSHKWKLPKLLDNLNRIEKFPFKIQTGIQKCTTDQSLKVIMNEWMTKFLLKKTHFFFILGLYHFFAFKKPKNYLSLSEHEPK
jgi:hypothetical protein